MSIACILQVKDRNSFLVIHKPQLNLDFIPRSVLTLPNLD
jgi:hypothetical protein